MKRILLIFILFTAAFPNSVFTQDREHIWAVFPDGACLEISTQSTGDTKPLSGMGGGMITRGKIYRFVVNSQDIFLFAYELEAKRATVPNAVSIKIKPLDPVIGAGMGNIATIPDDGHIPTVSAVREFSAVRLGDAVKLDILQNPATKETIYDVLLPVWAPDLDSGSLSITSKKPY